MRRILTILTCIVLGICMAAGQDYTVYRVDGTVVNTATGKAVKRLDVLGAKTMVNIGSNSTLQVIERGTNRIYRCNTAGKNRLGDMVTEIKEKSQSVFRTINAQVGTAVNGSPSQPRIGHRRGLTVRGERDDAVTLSTYNELRHLIKPTNAVTASTDSLVLSALFIDSDTFYFSISNLTNSTLYVNILCISPEGDATLCLDFSDNIDEPYLLINPGVTATLEDYVFLRSDRPSKYVLFASTEQFDSELLNQMIHDKIETTNSVKNPQLRVTPIEL